MRARLMDATIECLVEHGFAGTSTTLISERAGRLAGRPAATTSRPRTTWWSPPSSTSPRSAAPSSRSAAAAVPPRRPPHPRRPADARRPLRVAGLHRGARAVGRGPHRRRAAAAVGPAGAEGRPRDPPDDRRPARRRRVAARRPRARAGHPRPGPRPRPRRDHHRRLPASQPDPRPVGPHPRRGPWRAERPARRRARRPRRRGRPARGAGRRPPRRRAGARPTPAAGWDVATQIAHLAWTDEAAVRGRDRQGALGRAGARGAWPTPSTPSTEAADRRRWRRRRRLLDPLAYGARPARRGAPRPTRRGRRCRGTARRCRPTSMATARFMETWAHSLDVHEALGVEPEVTDRVRHVAHLGVRTRDFAFAVHGLDAPAEEFRVAADRTVRRPVGLGSRGRRADRDRRRRTTSACWSPSGSTAPTPRWSRSVATPTRGCPSRSASPAPRARDVSRDEAAPVGNCSGFYGDRLSAMREMLEGGRAGRAHRRLPRRADHADPRPRPAQGPHRSATRAPSCARSRTASGSPSSAA